MAAEAPEVTKPEVEEPAVPPAEAEVDTVLELTSEIEPPKYLKVDGELYELKSQDQLSPDEEARVTALFSRFQRQYTALEKAKNEQEATARALKLRPYREKLIATMTTIPIETVRVLSGGKQGRILLAIQEEIGGLGEDEFGDGGDDIDE